MQIFTETISPFFQTVNEAVDNMMIAASMESSLWKCTPCRAYTKFNPQPSTRPFMIVWPASTGSTTITASTTTITAAATTTAIDGVAVAPAAIITINIIIVTTTIIIAIIKWQCNASIISEI